MGEFHHDIRTVTAHAKITRILGVACWLLTACRPGEPGPFERQPDNHEQMVLESIPYDVLGTTRLVFNRDELVKRGLVELNGVSRTGSITYAIWTGGWVAASPVSRILAFEESMPLENSQRSFDIAIRNWADRDGTALGGPGGMRHTPSWSRDGSRVIYGEHTGKWAYLSTRIVTQSPAPGAADGQVLWSATLSCEFAYSPRQNGAGTLVFVYWRETTTEFCLLDRPRIARATPGGQAEVIYGPGSLVYAPTWSPSGEEIAFFEVGPIGPSSTARIMRMAADGSNPRTIATVPNQGFHERDFSMCWPGDGSRIFFAIRDSQAGSYIYSVAVASGVVTQITSAPGARDSSLSCS